MRLTPAYWRSALASALAVLVLSIALGALALPARLRIPKLSPRPAGSPSAEALFSHLGHGALSCYMCHPSIFPQALSGFTHREMQRGLYCGACHDGSVATPIAKLPCQDCHVEP